MMQRRIRKVVYRLKNASNPAAKAALRVLLSLYQIWDATILKRGSRPDLVSEKLVFRDRRILYVGVPKVATRSLIASLNSIERSGQKPEILEIDLPALQQRIPQIQSYFKFTFVRNPWSRVTSCYHDKIANYDAIKSARHLFNRYGLEAGMSFAAFVEWLNSSYGADDCADRHWMSQYRILGYDQPNPLEFDFIGRFENLANDYNRLIDLTGLHLPSLGHKLKTQLPDNYRSMYTSRTIDLIAQRYAHDIELFDYAFDGSPE